MNFGIVELQDVTPEDLVLLDKSVRMDPYTGMKDILEKWAAGDVTLWKGTEGPSRLMIVTQVLETSRGLELNVWHCAGEHLRMHRQAKMVHATLRRYAHRIGCERMVVYAVPNMIRTLAYVGYVPTLLRMETGVEDG